MSTEPASPEVEQRIERYLDSLAAGGSPDLEELARGLEREHERQLFRALALAQEYLALRADGRAQAREHYLGRLGSPAERERFQQVVRDAEAARASLPGELVPGVRLDGRYEILREVGHGGMGSVYAAVDRELQREVAIKVLRLPPGSALARDWEELFQRESRTLARLESKNIVAIHDARRGAEHSYIVMDLVRGRDLLQILREVAEQREQGSSPPSSPEPLRRAVGRAADGERADLVGERTHARCAARILREIAFTVERAHAAGVVHRDLKPQNVMLVPGGEPVLLDFGLASWGKEGAEDGFRGTPEYMAPEQIRELRAGSDPRTDVYQLGLLLYELLALRRAFPRKSGDELWLLFERITKGTCAPLAGAGGVPRALAAIAARAMAVGEADRYQSVRELREDLDRFLRGLPPLHTPVSRGLHLALWSGYVARRPLTAVAQALAAAAFFWLQPEPWVPPELAAFKVDGGGRAALEDGTAIEFRDTCVLGLRAEVDSRSWLYVFSLFGDKQGGRFLRPVPIAPLAALESGGAPSDWLELAPGTHELACARLADPSEFEGLLVIASAGENEPLARWQHALEESERASGAPVSYEAALRHRENLRQGLRGEPLGTLTAGEAERIFGGLRAAEEGDDRGALDAGLWRYHFLFPVKRRDASGEAPR